MDVRAILVVSAEAAAADASSIGGIPLALLDVLGRPVLQRVADHLLRCGVDNITVVSSVAGNAAVLARQAARGDLKWVHASGKTLWRTCEDVFSDSAQGGADLVMVQRVGAYAELDYEQLIQHHLDQRSRVTSVCDGEGELGVFLISASRRNDAAFLFRHELKQCRVACVAYTCGGYANRLRDARDLRQLTRDAFALKNAITPQGRQVRPGIWVADTAQVHRGARLVAPAFVGPFATVRAASVITRGSAVERYSRVDCGTVVEDTNVLPFSTVGVGLDVSHAVVGFGRLASLKHAVEVKVSDPMLVGMRSLRAPWRAAASAAAWVRRPMRTFRGALATSHRQPAARADAGRPRPEKETQTAEFPANLMVARRYGNE